MLLERLPSFLFTFFENFVEIVQKIFTEDHNKTKAYLAQAREGEERLRRNIKEFERLQVFLLLVKALILVLFLSCKKTRRT